MSTYQDTTPNQTQASSIEPPATDNPTTIPDSISNSQPLGETFPLLESHDEDVSKALIVMNISIGEGKKFNLPIMEDDDPYVLAQKFCKDHGIDEKLSEALALNIYDNMEEALKEAVSFVDESVRHSFSPKKTVLQFPRQGGDLLEPEDKSERLKKRVDSDEEEETLEQIEKQYSEQRDKIFARSNRRIMEGALEYQTRHETVNLTECSPIGKSSQMESLYMDVSLMSIMKAGDMLLEENKARPEDKKAKDRMYINIQRHVEEKDDDGFKAYADKAGHLDQMADAMEYPFEEEQGDYVNKRHTMHARTGSEGRGGFKKLERARTSASPQKNFYYKANFSPERKTKPGKTYAQMFSLKEAQKLRQQAEEAAKIQANQSHGYGMWKMSSSAVQMNTSSSLLHNKSLQAKLTESVVTEGMENKKETLKRARSGTRNKRKEELTFKPKINKLSEKIVEEKEKLRQEHGLTPYQRLFNEYKEKEARQEERATLLEKECTFTPSINHYAYVGSPIERMSFEERNKKFQDKMKLIQEFRQEQQLVDTQTGQPLFRPNTGRGPQFDRNRQNLPIGDYLYSRRSPIDNTPINNINPAPVKELPQRRQETTDKRCRTKLAAIFRDLDSDHDGLISALHIDINPIEPFELEIIAPVLCAMEELDKVLDKEHFTNAAMKVVKSLPYSERERFAGSNKQANNISTFTFKPEPQGRPEEFVRSKTTGNFDSLYEKTMMEKRNKEERIKREQERRRELELKECSFKPTINKKSSRMVKGEVWEQFCE